LALLPGRYTPQLQEAMTRLGSKLPFEQAAEEVWLNQHTQVEASTLRTTTYRHGQAAEAIERAAVERLEQEAPSASATPAQLLISADGAFIHLTSGEWREVKTLVVGEFERLWNAKAGEVQVKTQALSYFSRSYRIREFERAALAELHRRGVDNARLVVTVNDGSEWIQSFRAYHFPQAVQILDFEHAFDYVVRAGKALWGEGTAALTHFLPRMAHQLKHKPPRATIADLCLLHAQATTDEQRATVDQARRYLQKREALIDYPHFQRQGWPIGSGSVESSHKVVVHARMKQAGMRWAEAHVDPLLVFRNWVCNQRWSENWAQLAPAYWQQRRQELQEQARRQRPSPPPRPPISCASLKGTLASTEPAAQPPPPTKDKRPYRPAPDHPWRRDIWPTKEAWRWN
jgi:hypothetical protein